MDDLERLQIDLLDVVQYQAFSEMHSSTHSDFILQVNRNITTWWTNVARYSIVRYVDLSSRKIYPRLIRLLEPLCPCLGLG